MKTNLLRKIMLACWLAVMASMGTTKAQTYDIIDDKFNNGPIGEVSVTITNKGSDQYPNYQTTYAIKWLRGIQINKLQAPSRDFGQLSYHDSQDEKYYYVTRSFTGTDITDGDYKAQSSYEPITDPQIVCGIFNYFTPNSTRLNDGIIEVSSSVTGAEYGYGSYPLKLDFRAQNSIQIQIKENVKVENFPFEINGANVTCRMEGDGSSFSYSKTNELSSVTLNSGNFNLIGQVAGVSRFTMNGGVFTFDGEDGKCAVIRTMDITKGDIIVKNNKTNFSFNYLNINGDVTVTGENLITEGNLSSSYIQFEGALANNVTITNGNISFKEVGIHPTSTFLINNGNVVFEKATFTGFQFVGSGENSNIQLKSGSLLLDNCLLSKRLEDRDADYIVDVEGGILTVKDGFYQGGKEAFLRVSGASGQVIIENGHYRRSEHSSSSTITNDIFHQIDGKVEILNGTFQDAPICIEKGSLAIKGGYFNNRDNVAGIKSEKEFNLWIKDNQADVELSGGEFTKASIYMSPGVNFQPADLLAKGYQLYAEYNGYFDTPVTQAEDIEIMTTNEQTNSIQTIKTKANSQQGQYVSFFGPKDKSTPESLCWEVAQKADVGPNGKDVKVIKTREYSGNERYAYEINTPEGLIWLAASRNLSLSKKLTNGTEYLLDSGRWYYTKEDGWIQRWMDLGHASVKIMADLDMSGYEWVPFNYSDMKLDGQGHVISNLRMNHYQTAAFLSSMSNGILANLVIRNVQFNVTPKNPTLSITMGGLVGSNAGEIVNCGVQQANLSCNGSSDLSSVKIGGLVGNNSGSILNSYITGSIICDMKPVLNNLAFLSGKVSHYYGGISGGLSTTYTPDNIIDNPTFSNCYFAGEFECPETKSTNNISIYTDKLVWNGNKTATIENCYLDNEIDLSVLNKNKDDHNSKMDPKDI